MDLLGKPAKNMALLTIKGEILPMDSVTSSVSSDFSNVFAVSERWTLPFKRERRGAKV